MGNLPITSVLGISAMSFGTFTILAAIRNYWTRTTANPRSDAGPGEVFAWILSIACVVVGFIIHCANLDMDAGFQSVAFGFVGGNIGLGWMWYAEAEEDWTDFVPVIVGLVFVGLMTGLLTYDGDVQKLTKERRAREEEQAKALRAAQATQATKAAQAAPAAPKTT